MQAPMNRRFAHSGAPARVDGGVTASFTGFTLSPDLSRGGGHPAGTVVRSHERCERAHGGRATARSPDADGVRRRSPRGNMSDFVVITGLSGAGRSQAAD